jgi:signal peptidase I
MFRRQHQFLVQKLESRFGPTVASAVMFVVEILQIVIVSVAIIIPVREFLIKPFIVRGASMEPNFYDSEYLIIDELSYRFGNPERGDIVVFNYPRDPEQFFIKRVIGLPGETIEISDGEVSIYNDDNPVGETLEEEYIGSEKTLGKKRVELNDNEYFVMGDNRGYSLDSRSFGPIKSSDIVGRVWVRGFPFNRVGGFETPNYNL